MFSLFAAQRREMDLRSFPDFLWSHAGGPVGYDSLVLSMLAKHFGQCHVSSVPNFLDCLYGPALESCYGGAATVSLRVRDTDATPGTRRARLP